MFDGIILTHKSENTDLKPIFCMTSLSLDKIRWMCDAKCYMLRNTQQSVMIKSFRHKGLCKFYETGSTAGVQAKHAKRLRLQLAALDSAILIEDMNISGFGLHPLKGDMKGRWSITVNGNWRLTFEFEASNVYILDYEDYH